MADNMAYVPKPESGTKRPKMTTPRNCACDIALSTKSLKLNIFEVLMVFRMVAFRGGHWGIRTSIKQCKQGISNIESLEINK